MKKIGQKTQVYCLKATNKVQKVQSEQNVFEFNPSSVGFFPSCACIGD